MKHPFDDLTEEEISNMFKICRAIFTPKIGDYIYSQPELEWLNKGKKPKWDWQLGDWAWWAMIAYDEGKVIEAWTIEKDQRLVNSFKPQPVMIINPESKECWNLDIHCDESILGPHDGHGPHTFFPDSKDELTPLPLSHQWMLTEIWSKHDCYIEMLYLKIPRLFLVKDILDTELGRHRNPHYACCLAAHKIKEKIILKGGT